MSATAALRVPISPLPVVPLVTPQSMSRCCGPVGDGTVRRKKSPNPTRYMRTRSGSSAPVVLAMSQPPVEHREVDLEAARVVAGKQSEPLRITLLALLAQLPLGAVQMLADDVADGSSRRRILLLIHGWPRDDHRRSAAQRKAPHTVPVEVDIAPLHELHHHVGPQAAVGIDAEDGVEGRHRDLPRWVEAERCGVGLRVRAESVAVGVLLAVGEAVGVAEVEAGNRRIAPGLSQLPGDGALGEEAGALRDDAAQAECLQEGVAHPYLVGR